MLLLYVFPDEYDAYIIVSFVNATLVLSIGETVEEVTDSGFLGTTPTLSCSQLGDDALVQVKHGILCCLLPLEINVDFSLSFFFFDNYFVYLLQMDNFLMQQPLVLLVGNFYHSLLTSVGC